MTSLGKGNDIVILDQLLENHPTGILSVVADSYDIYAFTEAVIARKDTILARDGRFVLRPDSITPTHMTPATLTLALLEMLWDGFGGTETDKGYKVLDTHVRVLWGDGIDGDGIIDILEILENAGFAAENMVFGMGGGLLQKNIDRDTERFAFKCAGQIRSGEWYDISKEPLDASKKSKSGRLALVVDEKEGFRTVKGPDAKDVLETVFLDGEVVKMYTLEEVRATAEASAARFLEVIVP